jgi:DNA-binding CsgD family transcriptional regulator/tetratricopeptide (TPR) repeat protein
MELLERSQYLEELDHHFRAVETGVGHSVFLTGEAGIGKTSLLHHFLKKVENKATVYFGACDSLFTPRPLGPLFDIAAQIGPDFVDLLKNEKQRSVIFLELIQKFSSISKPVVLVFEDIHWADEATLDLIKFLGRRIYRNKCLFLLTYRDDEIRFGHPLSTMFGQLPAGHFTKIPLDRFSEDVVERMAVKKGFESGHKLFTLTGGNPFYVMEILESKNTKIPDSVKDSVLTVFYSQSELKQNLWEYLSILPSGIDLKIAKPIADKFPNCMEECMATGVIVIRSGYLFFKHELFRLAIEEALSPLRKRTLHKEMLGILQSETCLANLSQIVHHAKFADERSLVARNAPQAAREAAAVGAHNEACKLYATAIEYSEKDDPSLVDLYEKHAYECYLTNQSTAGIASLEKALEIWRKRKVNLKEGDTLRFLSRLWWFEADYEKAIHLAKQSIEILENGFPTRERAQAYSNISQLYMLGDNDEKAVFWGNKAIELAGRMNDVEILSHALNNVGSVLLRNPASEREGEEKLKESLRIALENEYGEHVARAYTNLSSTFLLTRRYAKALEMFTVGIRYCEEKDLTVWGDYMLSSKSQLLLEVGQWESCKHIAFHSSCNINPIIRIPSLTSLAKIEMRRGNVEEAKRLIEDARMLAKHTNEAQRIIPYLTAALELSWICGHPVDLAEIRKAEETLFSRKNNSWYYTRFAYWLHKCGIAENTDSKVEYLGPFEHEYQAKWKEAGALWKKLGCPYEEALALIESDLEDQRLGFRILEGLGASATSEMLRTKLKLKGSKNIPRGPHESTRKNPAQLTTRQVEILCLLQHGAQNKEIADKLFISPKTVDHHISAILAKLAVNSRAKAVLEARKLEIIK